MYDICITYVFVVRAALHTSCTMRARPHLLHAARHECRVPPRCRRRPYRALLQVRSIRQTLPPFFISALLTLARIGCLLLASTHWLLFRRVSSGERLYTCKTIQLNLYFSVLLQASSLLLFAVHFIACVISCGSNTLNSI